VAPNRPNHPNLPNHPNHPSGNGSDSSNLGNGSNRRESSTGSISNRRSDRSIERGVAVDRVHVVDRAWQGQPPIANIDRVVDRAWQTERASLNSIYLPLSKGWDTLNPTLISHYMYTPLPYPSPPYHTRPLPYPPPTIPLCKPTLPNNSPDGSETCTCT